MNDNEIALQDKKRREQRAVDVSDAHAAMLALFKQYTKKLVDGLMELGLTHKKDVKSYQKSADNLKTLDLTRSADFFLQTKNLTKILFSLQDHHISVFEKPDAKVEEILSNISLTVQIHELINAVLNVNKHARKTDDKYTLLREFGETIKSFKFESEEQRKNSLRNFFYLSLQRNQMDFKNTTDSGIEIRRLLNRPEYAPLKAFLFPELGNTPVKYRDLRKFVTGKENNTRTERKQNEKIFSSTVKNTALTFWTSNKNKLHITNSTDLVPQVTKKLDEKNFLQKVLRSYSMHSPFRIV